MNHALLYTHLVLGLFLYLLLWSSRVRPWRGAALASALLLMLTGAHNFMTKLKAPPPLWHAMIGLKILLALHVLAMVILLARGGNPQAEARWRRGALASATLVILIGLYYSNFAR